MIGTYVLLGVLLVLNGWVMHKLGSWDTGEDYGKDGATEVAPRQTNAVEGESSI